ncbi:PREDICTED: uncharacterized protein LOC106749544 isoform X2 [Dinoponera quadriceps]|uniref:Uncharacterized protein LOC106749544 isoform X2 n=1 Tax=Dinoponera quadriceps TaxID=609295 RepID=A0A6P3Y312_DINQU|nr:PREDICTED: uncharacterized protein LOC106749544 isoform X2 [Dinoponera quadriceps]
MTPAIGESAGGGASRRHASSMPCALNGEVIALHTWRNMHPSTPLPQLDRLARDIELAAFDEESVAVMAVIELDVSAERSKRGM